MAKYDLERLLRFTDDKELLDVYDELESGKVPATGYAHGFCRKINRMVDAGDLCVSDGKYRHVYLPTLSKALYKELAHRYTTYARNYKAPEPIAVFESTAEGAADEGVCKCAWCNGEYDPADLIPTDLGMLCEQCITAIRSRGEDVCTVQ